MKLRKEKVIVNNKERERYYVNEQRCTEDQYLKFLAESNQRHDEEEFIVNLLCKLNQCPKEWETLQLTSIDGIRFCNDCKRSVHMCKSWSEVEQLGRNGICVAIEHPFCYPKVSLGVPI